MIDDSQAISRHDDNWAMKRLDQIGGRVAFSQRRQQSPRSFDEQEITAALHEPDMFQHFFEFDSHLKIPRSQQWRHWLREIKGIYQIAWQRAFQQRGEQFDITSIASAKRFHDPRAWRDISQVRQQQGREEGLACAGVSSRYEYGLGQATGLLADRNSHLAIALHITANENKAQEYLDDYCALPMRQIACYSDQCEHRLGFQKYSSE